jgi:hypothetical protein
MMPSLLQSGGGDGCSRGERNSRPLPPGGAEERSREGGVEPQTLPGGYGARGPSPVHGQKRAITSRAPFYIAKFYTSSSRIVASRVEGLNCFNEADQSPIDRRKP